MRFIYIANPPRLASDTRTPQRSGQARRMGIKASRLLDHGGLMPCPRARIDWQNGSYVTPG